MSKKYFVILCMLAIVPLTGCDLSLVNYADLDDSYLVDDTSEDSPPDYIPPVPPGCVVYAGCEALMYNSQEETADVKVTIQNTSPDESALQVYCVVKMKNGSTVLVQSGINFYNISSGQAQTQWASCTIMKPQSRFDNFECDVTWQDDTGTNYGTQKTFQMYF